MDEFTIIGNEIIRGRTAKIVFKFVDPEINDPFDLSGAISVRICFIKNDGTILEKVKSDMTLFSGTKIGRGELVLSTVDTALLKAGVGQDIERVVEPSSGDLKSNIFRKILSVFDGVCS